ncbi:hypothetical protein FKP32DRAFT_85167 [Trametes sanguinea]|nr:hypothetical protein FKP32DRAFT_85167 [Trametes sanguinea]
MHTPNRGSSSVSTSVSSHTLVDPIPSPILSPPSSSPTPSPTYLATHPLASCPPPNVLRPRSRPHIYFTHLHDHVATTDYKSSNRVYLFFELAPSRAISRSRSQSRPRLLHSCSWPSSARERRDLE